MAEVTTTTNVVGAVVGAVALGTVAVVAAPIVVPLMGLGALGVAIVGGAGAIGTVAGGWLGYHATKPDPQQIQQLLKNR